MAGPSGSQVILMYNIRKADANDFESVFEMAHKFYHTTAHAKTGKFDVEGAVAEYIQMLEHGFMLVAELDEDVVGVIGCVVTPAPFPMDSSQKLCVERLWWVEPEYRGSSVGPRMHKAAEEEAKQQGAARMVMTELATSPPEVGEYYIKDGYALAETMYFKEL